ncbi:hypothetical protein SALBM311S_02500 [Streptomyces alboniger]
MSAPGALQTVAEHVDPPGLRQGGQQQMDDIGRGGDMGVPRDMARTGDHAEAQIRTGQGTPGRVPRPPRHRGPAPGGSGPARPYGGARSAAPGEGRTCGAARAARPPAAPGRTHPPHAPSGGPRRAVGGPHRPRRPAFPPAGRAGPAPPPRPTAPPARPSPRTPRGQGPRRGTAAVPSPPAAAAAPDRGHARAATAMRPARLDQLMDPRVDLVVARAVLRAVLRLARPFPGRRQPHHVLDRPAAGGQHPRVEDDGVDPVETAQRLRPQHQRSPLGRRPCHRGRERLLAEPGPPRCPGGQQRQPPVMAERAEGGEPVRR